MADITAVLCAVAAEAAPFLDMLEAAEHREHCSLRFVRGRLDGHEAVVVTGGMGKVNAAVAAQAAIDLFSPARLVISGVGGSLGGGLKLFDLLVCSRCTQYDAPLDFIGSDYPRLDSPWFCCDGALRRAALEANPTAHAAVMLTGDRFVDGDFRAELRERYAGHGPACADMETAAAAQACLAAGVPFAAIRAVSDTPEEDGQEIFWQNVAKAAAISAAATVKMLNRLKNF